MLSHRNAFTRMLRSDVIKRLCYELANSAKVIECVGKYVITPVFNLIIHIKENCPTDISVDKIEAFKYPKFY